MILPVFIPVDSKSYPSIPLETGRAFAIALVTACALGLVLMFGVFGSFKPYSYVFNAYKPYAHASELIPANVVALAKAEHITELESRPWAWIGSSPNLKGMVAGAAHEFKAESSYHPPYNRYRIEFGAEGVKLWLYTLPGTENEALITKDILRRDIDRAVRELKQDVRDAEFRRTGKL